MKKFALAFLSTLLLSPFIASAQEKLTPAVEAVAPIVTEAQTVIAAAPEQVPSDIAQLLQSMNGVNGAGAMGLVALLVQMLMLFLNSKYSALAGKYRFTIMSALTVIGGIIALKTQGVDTLTALTHSGTIAAYQVFANQAYKQFFKKES